ncbi:MAG TPA: nucleotidyl transferase AbiEii/AbiGii toxin family protein [Cellvibrionaceae bacterium]
MANQLSTNISLDKTTLNEIASELGVQVAFIEKDWYTCQALKAVASIKSDDFTVIFSGGTSLSKAHSLIQRFSEDLDFRCQYNKEMSGNQQKNARRKFKEQVVGGIESLDLFKVGPLEAASYYIKCELFYESLFELHDSLRGHLQIEFSFTQPQLEPTVKNVTSFVHYFSGLANEVSIPCLSPVEIAADKLSALCWRILKRDRNNEEEDDPTFVRHLHDLYALSDHINHTPEKFYSLFKASYAVDQKTPARQTGFEALEAMAFIVDKLRSDNLYKTEYKKFVDTMSYARDDEQISFDQTIKNLDLLAIRAGAQKMFRKPLKNSQEFGE